MNQILLITSSPRRDESLSTRFAAEIAEGIHDRLPGTLKVRDLAADPLPHISPAYIEGRTLPPEARSPEQIKAVAVAQTLVDELQAADVIVLGSGMINFGLPSQLKAWFDHVIWPGVTFSYGATGPKGLLSDKKVYIVTASGGVFSEGPYTSFDFQTIYLRHLLGFMGMSNVELIRIEGTVLGPDVASAAIGKAEATVEALLSKAT